MKKPKAITNDTVKQLLAVMDAQDALITRVSVETGLRTSDVLRLRRYNLWSKDGYYIAMQERKTNKQKVSEISESLYADLLHYFGARNNTFDHAAYLFIHRNNSAYNGKRTPIERTTYYKRLKTYAKGLGVDISPHSFRKLYARNTYAATRNIFDVQKAMNHKYTATTAGYLDIDINELILNALNPK